MSSTISTMEKKHAKLPLNDDLYDPDDEAKLFYKAETGIESDEDLKRHICSVQHKAYSIYQYPCIRIFEFMRLKLARLPNYNDLLKLGKERRGAIFIDLGCCFGNDCRKAVYDGFPVENVLASDLRKELWNLGHELFRSTPETFPVPFVEGDAFDPNFLDVAPPFTVDTVPVSPPPPLATVTSLNPLRGHVAAVFTGALFHLFSEDAQYRLAQALAGLLSPEPGSMLIGVHGGRAEKGVFHPEGYPYKMFCHSPDSWKELWEGIFGEGEVEVKARLRVELGGPTLFGQYPENTIPYQVLEWSVTRK